MKLITRKKLTDTRWTKDHLDEWSMDDLSRNVAELEKVIQMCFDDICTPSGKISKKTAIELTKHADRRV